MNSSSWLTFRLFVHPVDRHGRAQLSGRSWRAGARPIAVDRGCRRGRRRWPAPSCAETPASLPAPPACTGPIGPCRRGTALGLRLAGSSRAAPAASGPRARHPDRLASTTSPGDSTRPGRHSAQSRRSFRSAAKSGGAPGQAARLAGHCRAAAPAPRSGARPDAKARGQSPVKAMRPLRSREPCRNRLDDPARANYSADVR
jgi:hypothetical protein